MGAVEFQLPTMLRSLALVALFLAVASARSAESTTEHHTTNNLPKCKDFTCPNMEAEGGLFAHGACSPEFCECSYGIAYLLTCEEGLVFNEPAHVCDWPFNVPECDTA